MESETDGSTNASALLQSMMGEITEQQCETYKMMKSARGNLVDDCDSQSDSSSDAEQAEVEDISKPSTSAQSNENEEIIVAEIRDCFDDVLNVSGTPDNWDIDLTFKYIDGKLSFDELANAMEEKTRDDRTTKSTDNDEIDVNDGNELGDDESDQTNDPDWEPYLEFEKELLASQQKSGKRRSRTRTGGVRKRRLPLDLQGLVGEANLCFARGQHEDAIRMCLEVIRNSPTAPEPFQTLGMLYEEMGDLEKAYQYHLIAAYLCPSDGDNWVKVAEMAVEQENYQQAISCYGRAVKLFPSNIDLHWQRCKLFEKVGDFKRALEGYESVLKALKPNDGDIGVPFAKEIAKIHFSNNNLASSIQVMETAFEKYPNNIASEDVNLYVELLISEKLYVKALIAFNSLCGVMFSVNGHICESITEELLEKEQKNIVVTLPVEDVFPVDLRSKLIVCLIHVRCIQSVPILCRVITNESAETMGDLYLDIADAYITVEMYSESESLLAELIYTQTYNLAPVWLRYARCLKKLDKIEESIAAYYEVVHQAPDNHDAKLELTDLLIGMGRHEDATEATGQEGASAVSLDLLLLRCKLLYQQELWNDFVVAAKLLLRNDMYYLTHEKEIAVMISSSTHRTRLESVRDVHKELGILKSREMNFIGNKVSPSELMDVYLKLCHTLCHELRNTKELQRIIFSSYTSNSFRDMSDSLDYYAVMAMFLSRNLNYCYALTKAVISRNPRNNHAWNIFCVMMMRYYQDLRHNRFCLRLFIKNPDILALAYYNGHNALVTGSYKHALAEYVNIHKNDPKDPFAVFCISLGFSHLACQKFITNRHSIVIQLCAFLQMYYELRGECQEVLFNIGRTFHQLGLVHEAIHFYKRALDSTDDIVVKKADDLTDIFDLRREIAFNLALIYQNSGANDYALHYLRRFIVF